LYRNIHLDLAGWAFASKNLTWSPGSLPLLLRTLQERPELGQFVRCIALDWCCDFVETEHEQGVADFLQLCSGLQALFTQDMLPEKILTKISHIPIRTFASSYSDGRIPRIFGSLSALQTLILLKFRGDSTSAGEQSCRTLKNLKLQGSEQPATLFVTHALELCSGLASVFPATHDSCLHLHPPISISFTWCWSRARYLALAQFQHSCTP
jgi:hypothetical protein